MNHGHKLFLVRIALIRSDTPFVMQSYFDNVVSLLFNYSWTWFILSLFYYFSRIF